jgi:transglutaminase-like putative cysteine protease
LNRYNLVHVTNFSYDGPVSESYNELRLRPRHDEGQSCLSFKVNTNPFAKAIAHRDFYGNWVHVFHILREHRTLRVETEAVVLMHPQPAPAGPGISLSDLDTLHDSLLGDHYDFLSASQYCPILPEISDLTARAEQRCDGSVAGFAESASSLIHELFEYRKGATHVHSSIADCLESRSGVCQDFSHLLIAVLRARGVPARYVSGYLVPRQEQSERAAMERVIGGLASHAWVQAFTPDLGWFGLDPTTGAYVEAQHVRVAYGRDYGDVPPVRGVYKGHAGQNLSVDVRVRPEVDDEGTEILQETAAVPPVEPDEETRPVHQQQQQQQ